MTVDVLPNQQSVRCEVVTAGGANTVIGRQAGEGWFRTAHVGDGEGKADRHTDWRE